MRPLRRLNDQRGMILLTSLLILSFLIALGIGSVVSVQSEYRIADNLKSGTSALYIAEAGIEWAKQQIGLSNENPPVLLEATENFSVGQFSIGSISSRLINPLASQVVYRSDGKLRTAMQAVQVQVKKFYDLADAALVLRGNSRGIRFAGNAFTASGLDYDPVDGAPIRDARQRHAISADNSALLTQIRDTVNASKTVLTGTDTNGASTSLSDRIAADTIQRLAAAVCAASQAQLATAPADGRLLLGDQTWGSLANPQIHCIQGLSDSGDQVIAAGNLTGAGILVIRDALVVLSGNFRWDGLVIVAGNDVGVRISGEQGKDLYGALIVSETGLALGTGDPMIDVDGTMRIRFSRSALASAARLIPSATLNRVYGALPFYITQDYWRMLTP